jgi:hypothetical protein
MILCTLLEVDAPLMILCTLLEVGAPLIYWMDSICLSCNLTTSFFHSGLNY